MNRHARGYFGVLIVILLISSLLTGTFPLRVRAVPQAVVTIGDSFYSPQEVTVLVGSVVLWQNTGTLSHTSTSSTGLWSSGPILPGGSYQSPVFATVGVFNYHSSPPDSSQMTGKIIVVPTSANTLFAGTVDEGLLTGYVIAILFAFVVIFWLNYPSSQAKARARVR